jgi:hypothetical protein
MNGTQTGFLTPVIEPRLSYLGLEPGLMSDDGVVVVGKSGFLFIAGGNNNVLGHYTDMPATKVEDLALKWRHVIAQRSQRLSDEGVAYIQIIIPEKSSLLPDLIPFDFVRSETPLLAAIEAHVRNDCPGYVSVLSDMRESNEPTNLFRRMDSHLSPSGALTVFNGMLTSLGLPGIDPIPFTNSQLLASDLAPKLCHLPFREEVMFPDPIWQKQLAAVPPHNTEYFVPSDGQHIGTRSIWKNDSPMHDHCCVVFGNSFFERGQSPCNLTWWAARCFREVHFLWSPSVDYTYLKATKADLCICQTIERFAHMVPRT